MIPRFYDVADGNIIMDGKSIYYSTIKSLRNNIGVVQQEVFLFTCTIKENILYGKKDASDDEVIKVDKMDNIDIR